MLTGGKRCPPGGRRGYLPGAFLRLSPGEAAKLS